GLVAPGQGIDGQSVPATKCIDYSYYPWRLLAPEPREHLGHAAGGELLHHLLHLLELIEQRVELLHRGATAPGDAAAPAGVEDGRIATLGDGHGADDGLDALDLRVVDLRHVGV